VQTKMGKTAAKIANIIASKVTYLATLAMNDKWFFSVVAASF